MSADHVPETDNREEQLAELHAILLGHAAFGRLRGTLNGSLTGFIDDCIDQGNPSAALRVWDARVADLRVMLNLLSKFRRDGWSLAEMELKRALTDRKYVLPGETVPLEATTPYTVFMVDPEITLAMHQFFQDWRALFPGGSPCGISRPSFWESYRDEAFCLERYGPALWPLFQKIDWRWEGDRFRSIHPFVDVMDAFGERVRGIKARRVGKRTMEFAPWGLPRGNRWRFVEARLTGNNRTHLSAISCLYGKAVEQSDLLAAFSRDDQKRIASWQFHLPSALVGGQRRVYVICLRSEAEHARWRKERPQFTSRGVAYGYCAILTPIDSMTRVFAGEDPNRLRLFHNSDIFGR